MKLFRLQILILFEMANMVFKTFHKKFTKVLLQYKGGIKVGLNYKNDKEIAKKTF